MRLGALERLEAGRELLRETVPTIAPRRVEQSRFHAVVVEGHHVPQGVDGEQHTAEWPGIGPQRRRIHLAMIGIDPGSGRFEYREVVMRRFVDQRFEHRDRPVQASHVNQSRNVRL